VPGGGGQLFPDKGNLTVYRTYKLAKKSLYPHVLFVIIRQSPLFCVVKLLTYFDLFYYHIVQVDIRTVSC
jgi:hypothetical protein